VKRRASIILLGGAAAHWTHANRGHLMAIAMMPLLSDGPPCV
jgi:hypothetical protein